MSRAVLSVLLQNTSSLTDALASSIYNSGRRKKHFWNEDQQIFTLLIQANNSGAHVNTFLKDGSGNLFYKSTILPTPVSSSVSSKVRYLTRAIWVSSSSCGERALSSTFLHCTLDTPIFSHLDTLIFSHFPRVEHYLPFNIFVLIINRNP